MSVPIITVKVTLDDVDAIAQEHNISIMQARSRAMEWARRIEQIASTSVYEQLTNCIIEGQPWKTVTYTLEPPGTGDNGK